MVSAETETTVSVDHYVYFLQILPMAFDFVNISLTLSMSFTFVYFVRICVHLFWTFMEINKRCNCAKKVVDRRALAITRIFDEKKLSKKQHLKEPAASDELRPLQSAAFILVALVLTDDKCAAQSVPIRLTDCDL